MNQRIKAIIIDDSIQFCKVLELLLLRHKDIELVGIANTFKDGKNLIEKYVPELLFLDVELDESDGFSLLKSIESDISKCIYTTIVSSHQKYVINSLRESCFDFLHKPVDAEELGEVISRFKVLKQNRKDNINVPLKGDKRLCISTVKGFIFTEISGVGYFEYDKIKKNWYVYLSGNEILYLKKSTNSEQITGLTDNFVQINKTQIINIAYLAGIENTHCIMHIPFLSVKHLTISQSNLKKLVHEFKSV